MNTQSVEATNRNFVRAASLASLPEGGRITVKLDGHVIALFHTPEGIFAVDNRCPHMGFPLDRGTVNDCILTCHWHHARFDLHSGGAFDPWADDVRAFPVKVEGGEIWIDLAARGDSHRHRVERLRDGIERNLSLVIGKSVIAMLDETGDAREVQQDVLAPRAPDGLHPDRQPCRVAGIGRASCRERVCLLV